MVIHISIHSLRMEGDGIKQGITANDSVISIHSLRMEGDRIRSVVFGGVCIFQSTPSAWRETFYTQDCTITIDAISIHSLRMEGDVNPHCGGRNFQYFNPLPPHGGRQKSGAPLDQFIMSFQSTPSAWRETVSFGISIPCSAYFNPLPPHGGRLMC